MSLKAFHIFFIVVSIALSLFLTLWEARIYLVYRESQTLAYVALGIIASIALGAYLSHAFKKYKDVGLV